MFIYQYPDNFLPYLNPNKSKLVILVPPGHRAREPVGWTDVTCVAGKRGILTDLIDNVGWDGTIFTHVSKHNTCKTRNTQYVASFDEAFHINFGFNCHIYSINHHTEACTKWQPWQKQFQRHFLKENCFEFWLKFYWSMCWGNGLLPNRQQAITWINNDDPDLRNKSMWHH